MATCEDSILAADVGGTNTRLHLYSVCEDDLKEGLQQGRIAPGKLLLTKKYMNQDYSTFIEIVESFLKDGGLSKPPLSACFAVAGPVSHNKVKFTNRGDWTIEGREISAALGISKVRLVNG